MHLTNLKLQTINSRIYSHIHLINGLTIKACAVLILTVLFSISMVAQDQIKKGTYALNGSIGFSSITSNQGTHKFDESNFSFYPSISYFVIDHLELALSPSYSTYSSREQSSSSHDNSGKHLGLGFGIRYYFFATNIAPFIGANAQSSWSSRNGSTYSSPNSYGIFVVGVDIFIAKSLAVEPALSYFSERLGDQFTLSGFSLVIGVKYFIIP
ncbi:MAG: hypothetical protein EHM64_04225 [Ignavibacteriae bacterium]|nr:MAG: hypothetical protein EHM64_04225 [Ignavibacteriota bacterium]